MLPHAWFPSFPSHSRFFSPFGAHIFLIYGSICILFLLSFFPPFSILSTFPSLEIYLMAFCPLSFPLFINACIIFMLWIFKVNFGGHHKYCPSPNKLYILIRFIDLLYNCTENTFFCKYRFKLDLNKLWNILNGR